MPLAKRVKNQSVTAWKRPRSQSRHYPGNHIAFKRNPMVRRLTLAAVLFYANARDGGEGKHHAPPKFLPLASLPRAPTHHSPFPSPNASPPLLVGRTLLSDTGGGTPPSVAFRSRKKRVDEYIGACRTRVSD